jgi:phosphoenolpyruvate carboxykinase (GTP)
MAIADLFTRPAADSLDGTSQEASASRARAATGARRRAGGTRRGVDEIAALTQPARIHWVDGSRAENEALLRQQVDEGKLIKLNPEWRPGSYLARSHPSDVARTEGRTFIASERERMPAPPTTGRAPPRCGRPSRRSSRVDARAHDVRRPVLDGRRRRPAVAHRRADHRLRLRRHLDRHHDPRRHRGPRADRRGKPWVKTVHSVGARSSPARRMPPGPATTRSTSCTSPTPSRCGRSVGLRRQRHPREEVLRPAHRLGHRS